MKVSNVLESLPGVGKVRAQKLMEELDISASRRVRGLGAKQREQLLERFARSSTALATRRGTLIVIAGPSGVGKGSVVTALRARTPTACALSVSATTRPPRSGEVTGVDYVFVDDAEFSRMVEAGELLEWAEVFGNRYGTPRAYVDAELDAGHDVILEIDVQGAQQVRDAGARRRADPPRAAHARGAERRGCAAAAPRARNGSPSVSRRRTGSWRSAASFDHVVVNDDLERASSQVAAIIDASRAESSADGRDPTEDRSG